jgi:anti-sigma factor RsiW
MNCRSVRNQLSPHVDGRLPMAAAHQVEAHLERCAPCRAELADLRALKMLLAGAAPPQAPPGFWEAVHADLREHAGRRPCRPGQRWLAWAWGRAPMMAAGLAVLLLVAIVPVQYLEESSTRGGVTIDELVARHAGYCARQPLLEHGRLHYLVAEAGVDVPE